MTKEISEVIDAAENIFATQQVSRVIMALSYYDWYKIVCGLRAEGYIVDYEGRHHDIVAIEIKRKKPA